VNALNLPENNIFKIRQMYKRKMRELYKKGDMQI